MDLTPNLPVASGGMMPLTTEEREQYRPEWGTKCVIVHTGELLEVYHVKGRREKWQGKKRKCVSGFSPSSRLRMLRTVASIDWSGAGRSLFVTLTYPDVFADRGLEARTRDRYLFHRSMENYLGRKVCALWRVEWKCRRTGQRIGHAVPHYHLIVLGVPFIQWQAVRSWWRRVLHADGALSTDVRRIGGAGRVARYVCKYAAKPSETLSLDDSSKVNMDGRHWGIMRKSMVPFFPRNVFVGVPKPLIDLAENGACSIFRYFTRDAQQGFCLMGELAAKLGEEIFLRAVDYKKPT